MLNRISEIEKIYSNWYSPDSPLSHDDQKWIWENTKLPKITKEKNNISYKEKVQLNQTEGNSESLISPNRKCVIESESVIGGCKLRENLEETLDKNTANALLRGCNYLTAPKVIADYLKVIFGDWPEKPGHWLFIAQRYPPKSINSVVSEMIKRAKRGENTFQVPGAYFTKLIKFHPLRKTFRRSVKGPVTNPAKENDRNQG